MILGRERTEKKVVFALGWLVLWYYNTKVLYQYLLFFHCICCFFLSSQNFSKSFFFSWQPVSNKLSVCHHYAYKKAQPDCNFDGTYI
jgi:hypothetical protein